MKTLRIGMVGTFDVANFGDLLFPLLARHELAQRLGPVEIRPFSYHARSAPRWPFDVTPLERLATELPSLDLLLVGGGDIIRFDRRVAPGYRSSSPRIHHPTGFWLSPIFLANLASVPVAWNAPGLPAPIPRWAWPLVRASVAISRYVSVRDIASRELLAPIVPDSQVEVVPDTGFNASALLTGDAGSPSRRSQAVAAARPDIDGYLVVQSRPEWRSWLPHPAHDSHSELILTPVAPALGDLVRAPRGLPSGARFHGLLDPFQMLDLIAGSSGVIGTSLHLSIAALSLGRLALRPKSEALRKYRMLEGLRGVSRLDQRNPDGLDSLVAMGTSAADTAQLAELGQRLARHWDTIASLATAPRLRSARTLPPDIAELWEALPATLERRSTSEDLRTVIQAARRRVDRFRYTRGRG